MCNTVLGKKSGVIVAKFSRIESVEMVVGHPIVGGGMMIENDGCLVERSRQHTPFTWDAILCKRVEHDPQGTHFRYLKKRIINNAQTKYTATSDNEKYTSFEYAPGIAETKEATP